VQHCVGSLAQNGGLQEGARLHVAERRKKKSSSKQDGWMGNVCGLYPVYICRAITAYICRAGGATSSSSRKCSTA
jgi:hypothetical protein